ncbi:MAG: hypothetical protein IJK31_01285 [Ruminococcus sp.]|nr:hypothetical protein [Ruminococcus sp.]
MNKRLKFLPLVLSGLLFLAGMSPAAAYADEPYDVYNYDRWGEAIPSQAGYTAERSISGRDLGAGPMDEPSDLFCDHEGNFYIADTGNDRIIVADNALEKTVRIYDRFIMPDGSETTLSKPAGVFVSEERDWLYIADNQNSRVLVSDMDGNVVLEVGKPESDVYDQQRTFLPQKVIADKAGNIYVVLNNITTGAAMFSPSGDFTGFYGANRVEPTAEIITNYIKNIFRSDEKKASMARNVPSGISGFDIDGDFIFTCSQSVTQTTDTVKKLNAAGKNIFAGLELAFGDYTPMYDTANNKLMKPAIVDIDISDDGSINCLDRTTGRIFQYDEECNLMFIVGTKARQVGGFDTAAAVESYGSRLYVLDSAKDTITEFTETSFGAIVHEATALYNDGYYEEALDPWYEVLKRDGNYRRAYIGVASALLRKGDYKGAMKYAKLADSPKLYDKAFEAYRREFLRKHFGKIAAGILIAAGAVIVLKRRKKHGAAVTETEEKEE